MKLTWGDVLVATFAACLADGLDAPLDEETFFQKVDKILKVTGPARDCAAGRQALKGGGE
ncbi:hypothetical protein [Brucella intermedia]|uniref:hypothetical protein n=1 Tax=Brucella intermedia TaxID=94625 RepID=UPI00244CA57E|nr:hypothetical protein [Brucella intermedia]WGG61817.1 hypothetical protein QA414_14955 [Brucella intermedia]